MRITNDDIVHLLEAYLDSMQQEGTDYTKGIRKSAHSETTHVPHPPSPFPRE
jgi:hypothetical protein